MKNYEGYLPAEKLRLVPEDAVIQVSIPGLEGPPEDIPIGQFCKEAIENLDHLGGVVSTSNMQLENIRKQVAKMQKEIHDLRGSVMQKANEIAQGLKEHLEARIKTLEAELKQLKEKYEGK